ncbi:hypothetical protein [Leifsonia poae]|uniref:hypothetical protein n=1 Tax=Leifsonia poae TaxID=110933 RepID=UPI001CBBF57A|nr:hypothetical protein [Leifsonia poae]
MTPSDRTLRIRTELDELVRAGARLTGTAAHDELIDRVAAQWTALGMEVRRDAHEFTRWDEPENTALTVDGQPVPIASVVPYSGTTGVDGVSGRLVRLRGPLPRWKRATGAIAVVEVVDRTIDARHFIGSWDRARPWGGMRNPLIPTTLASLGLRRARTAGVAAVVFAWRGLSDDEAAEQYIPFTLPYQDLPAVFVSGAAARTVLDGGEATLTLPAELVPGVQTETIWAVVAGTVSAHESVLAVSHSDGTNAVEENGHLGLTEIARDLLQNPPRRTTVLVLTSGHLRIPAVSRHGQATSGWLETHFPLWRDGTHAVGALAIEHLGARDPASGATIPELLYADTAELAELVRQEWPDADGSTVRVSRPSALIHFGEGEPMHERRIPTVALVTAPDYLLVRQHPGLGDIVDPALAERQIDAFRRLRRRLDELPAGDLGIVPRANAAAKAAALTAVVGSFAASTLRPVR